MNSRVKVFNNEVEIGLRILVVLEVVYPKSFDIETLNYYDYFILHTKDIGGKESLHADVPNRFGELSVKRELIRNSLQLLSSRGLVDVNYTDDARTVAVRHVDFLSFTGAGNTEPIWVP